MKRVRGAEIPTLLLALALFAAILYHLVPEEINDPPAGNSSSSQVLTKAPKTLLLAWPVEVVDLSSPFGVREGVGREDKNYRFHTGVDLRRPEGTPFKAAASGVVKVVKDKDDGYGLRIVIDHGAGLATRYAHNSENLVAAGDQVEQGQVIGKVGRTGRTTGSHLHFEVLKDGKPVDPLPRLPKLATASLAGEG